MGENILYPADVVDADGKAWPTIGENIRSGSINTERLIKSIFGENARVLTVNVSFKSNEPITVDNNFKVTSNTIYTDKPILSFFLLEASISGSFNGNITLFTVSALKKIGIKVRDNLNSDISGSLKMLVVI